MRIRNGPSLCSNALLASMMQADAPEFPNRII